MYIIFFDRTIRKVRNWNWNWVPIDGTPCIWNGIIYKQLFIHPFILFQKCFTDRGWQRGKLVFLDLLALQFPNHNDCNVFLQLNRSGSEVPQKLPNERCSIVEEVSLLTEIRLCNNEAQVSCTIGLNPFLNSSVLLFLSDSHQAIIRVIKQPLGSYQTAIRPLSDSHQTTIRQPTDPKP